MTKLIHIYLITVFFYSCQDSVSENVSNGTGALSDSEQLVSSKIITTDGSYFAHKTDKGIIELDPPVYTRGATVYFVLRNVGDFAEDSNGESHFEMHMKVCNSIGEVIAQNRNILKDRGKRKLKNNKITYPNARFVTSSNEKPGTYQFVLTLEDVISSDSITVRGDFFIE